ncbi:Cyclin-dependent protein kinase inhibitor SMR9, partial [Mucuna pruriens]
MAPPRRRTTTTATSTATRTTSKTNTRTTKTRRTRQQKRRTTTTTTHVKKKQQYNTKSKKQEVVPTVLPSSCSSISSQDSSKEVDMHGSEVIDVSNNSPCSTPKGHKFRIPEISTCPPAPKKPRVLSNCSLRRSPHSFFSPPDLEHFFFVALRDVSKTCSDSDLYLVGVNPTNHNTGTIAKIVSTIVKPRVHHKPSYMN